VQLVIYKFADALSVKFVLDALGAVLRRLVGRGLECSCKGIWGDTGAGLDMLGLWHGGRTGQEGFRQTFNSILVSR